MLLLCLNITVVTLLLAGEKDLCCFTLCPSCFSSPPSALPIWHPELTHEQTLRQGSELLFPSPWTQCSSCTLLLYLENQTTPLPPPRPHQGCILPSPPVDGHSILCAPECFRQTRLLHGARGRLFASLSPTPADREQALSISVFTVPGTGQTPLGPG